MKQPERYVPIEQVEDDYSDHEDVADSDVSSEISYDSDELSDSEESEGSLKEFVVESDQEDDDGGSSTAGSIVQSLHDGA